jgi:hypothetical protein
MIIWELSTTNGETTSYRFFGLKGEASKAKRAFKKDGVECEGPTKVSVKGRAELIGLLDRVRKIMNGEEEANEEANEFL